MDRTSRREDPQGVPDPPHPTTSRATLIILAFVAMTIGVLFEILSPKARLSTSFLMNLIDKYSTEYHYRAQHIKERTRSNYT